MAKLGGRIALAAAVAALGACSGKAGTQRNGATGGLSGTVGSGGSDSGSGGAAGGGVAGTVGGGAGSGGLTAGNGGGSGDAGSSGGGSGGQAGDACPEVPVPTVTSGALLELTTELTFGGELIQFGEPNPLEGGGTLMPLEVRFYLSEASLVRSDGTMVNADIVSDAGVPMPYGVHLVNAEEPESLRVRLLGRPGSYSAVSFTLGLNDACNDDTFSRQSPLSAASAMTWPPGFGYLFLRYSGMVQAQGDPVSPDAGGGEGGLPGAIHMGGLPRILFAPRVEARGNVTLDASTPAALRLAFDLGELFRAATSSIDVSDYPVPTHPEVLLGEKVRRMAPELALFTLSPP